MRVSWCVLAAGLLFSGGVVAADYPAPVQGDYVAHDFHFHDGSVMKELRLHYTTVGAKTGEPVLVLHGTAGSGTGLLSAGLRASCSGRASRSMRRNTT